MSTTRFVLTNLAEAATVKNGSGGGAPARDESGLFTMERALNADRRSLWKSSSAAATLNFDLDLGGIRAVRLVSLHGFTAGTAATSGFGGGLVAQYAAAYYPGAWTVAGTAYWALGARDVGALFDTVNARYWRLSITPDTPGNVTVGRIVIGTTATYDLGGIHSPGGISSPFQNRIEQAMEDGSFNVNTLGFAGRDFSFPFNQVPSATRDKLMAVAAATGSVVLVDAEDVVYEVLVTGGRASSARNHTLYNVALECRRLP